MGKFFPEIGLALENESRNILLIFLFPLITLMTKIYYGFAWLCKKRARKAFLPYYRISMTYLWTMFFFYFEMDLIFILVHDFDFDSKFVKMVNRFLFLILEILFLHIYMRHLDKVHFAKNDLNRDK